MVNLSSAAQMPVSRNALEGKSHISSQEAYAQSKLALTMWSFHLAKVHPELNVIALNPGSLLNTNMVREAYGRFWSSADKGAKIIFGLATDTRYHKASGKYLDNDRGAFGQAHQDAYNEKEVTSLIQETARILQA